MGRAACYAAACTFVAITAFLAGEAYALATACRGCEGGDGGLTGAAWGSLSLLVSVALCTMVELVVRDRRTTDSVVTSESDS